MKRLLSPLRLSSIVVLALLLAGCALPQALMPKPSATEDQGADRKPTARTLYSMARILAAQGKDSECQFVLRRIIQDYPRFMPAYSELAGLYMRTDQVDHAIDALTRGLEVSANQPILINNLGMCYLVKGDHDLALQRFTEVTRLAPQTARYQANKAVALGMMGNYEESFSVFAQNLTAWEAHHNLAVLCEARHDFQRATAEFALAERLKAGEKHAELEVAPDRTARLDSPEVTILP